MKYTCILAMLCLLCLGEACTPEQVIGPFSDAPILHTIQLSQDSIYEFVDSVYLDLSYEDATGDLGFSSANQKSLWLKDSRLEEADLYHVAPLAPLDEEVHIQGSFRINLGSLFLISNDDLEKIIFKVKIRDREGNWSKEVESDTLYLLR